MAEEKKISTEEAENNTEDKKKDKLDALLFDEEDEDYDETSDEEEFDAFMEEYRVLIGKKFNPSAEESTEESVEEEKPEEVLITLPKKPARKSDRAEKKKVRDDSEWDEGITLAPESYEDEDEAEADMHEELPVDEESDFDLGEESDEDGFQISINFGADEEKAPEDEPDEEENVSKYDPEKPRAIDWAFDIAEMFVFVLLAVMILTSFFFRHSIVEGRSMMNTLEDGDHLIISDFLYYPERGDIVVFEDYSTVHKKAVVKRVIALPGDTVEIRFNEVGDVVAYVNGELLEESYAYNSKDVSIDTSSFNKVITVPEGEIFVMGDNRYHSSDSRSADVGTVRIDCILGKVVLRFMPFNKFGTVD